MKQTLSIVRKELDGYFSSPMALIFVGVFLAATLFSFFWVEGFWARGTADVRPLFRSMPLLMIFLVAALTMRSWSEEQQTGTLEILFTMPIRVIQLVIGKFIAVLILVIVALLLTFFLPLTISLLGPIDFGPVIGGYVAALLLASAYIAIGLFVSSRTDNQIVALILTALVAGFFHIIGTPTITDLFDSSTAEILRNLSTSGRFSSIERGVIDARDLIYYLALTVSFLALNVISLDSMRWGTGPQMAGYRRNAVVTASLVILNLVVFNLLVFPVTAVRADLTADQLYSLSGVTRETLNNLQEPLLIRGYFSDENHPLLKPLIPQIRDTLEEYAVVAGDELTVEFVDPITDADLEIEANQTYGIQPTPLQTTDRSGTSLLNIYFDILIRYGDQSEVLNFQDLIEFDEYGTGFDVRLRNLEYDLTSAIRRAVRGFQNIDAILASFEQPAQLTLYTTPETLPEVFAEVPQSFEEIAADLPNLNHEIVTVTPEIGDELFNTYRIQPIATSFFSTDTYYLHIVVTAGDRSEVIYPTGSMSQTEIRTAVESALKRMSSGFLQVVGIWRPPVDQTQPSLGQYTFIQQVLNENYEVRSVDLSEGQVPTDIDVLLVIAPQNMSDFERFAVDQYLMRSGNVLVAAGNYTLAQDQTTGDLTLQPISGGLNDVLAHYGVFVQDTLVVDQQNEPFPIQVQRNIGNQVVTELRVLDYPYFVDIRSDNMEGPITSNLPAVTLNWASPLTVQSELDVTTILQSSGNSWTTRDAIFQPDFDLYRTIGFPTDQIDSTSYPLAVSLEGAFSSYFADQPGPFEAETENNVPEEEPELIPATLTQSPETARLVVVGSAEFLNDNVFGLSSNLSGDRYLNNVQLIQNAVDWFVEDTELAAIRARGGSVRLLEPLTEDQQSQWEIINYVLALVSVFVIGIIWRANKRADQPMELVTQGGES
jgi:ABC-2 type transport system permease protein